MRRMPAARPADSLARPLALAYALLVAYACLHPLTGWRDSGLPALDWLWAPWPRYFILEDFLFNILGYLPLGQAANTLSGGEAQRVKLALELSKRDTGRTLYILDEPTTGLHFADIDLLLKVLHQLRDAGNTIVIIEHNLDVIKTADWLIDMGPEGGAGGGTVLGEGTPEQLAKNKASFTGHYLARLL